MGSQEGAFENVRLNLTGEQGQALRQLLTNYDIRRVAMCALTSVKGKRQHLCVNHDKGKLTFLQLFPILKQADSSRRKLTLTVSQQRMVLLYTHVYVACNVQVCTGRVSVEYMYTCTCTCSVFHTGGGSPGISHPYTQVSPSKLYYMSHIHVHVLCITFPPKVASGPPPSGFQKSRFCMKR